MGVYLPLTLMGDLLICGGKPALKRLPILLECTTYKKLSDHRGTTRCATPAEILSTAAHLHENVCNR